MYKMINQLYFIINERAFFVYYVIFLFLILALIDLLGVGMIIPYMQIVLNQQELTFVSELEFLNFFNQYEYNKKIIYFSSFLFFLFLFKTVLLFFISYILVSFESNLSIDVKKKLIKSYLFQEYKDFINFKSERALENIVNLSAYVSKSVLIPILKILSDLIIIILISIFLAYLNFIVFISVISFLIICVLAYNLYFKNLLFESGKNMSLSQQNIIKNLKESLQGYKEFTVLNLMPYFLSKFNKSFNLMLKSTIYNRFSKMIPSLLAELLLISFFISMILLSLIFQEKNLMLEIPTFGAFAYAAFKIFPKFTSISLCLAQINTGKYAIPIIYEDLKIANNKLLITEGDKLKKNENHNLEFKKINLVNISFSYENSKIKVLDNINCQIFSNKINGIIGKSGSGKTTLLDIILKFLKPSSGNIFLDNSIDLVNDVEIINWYSHISYIPQKITLINGSILENITFSKDLNKIDMNKFKKSLHLSKCDEFISKISKGYDYIIGESGIKLSGGQLQRIALARSFYQDKKIIILDESTSALDSKIENQILMDLNKIKKDYTIIIISHKKNILDYCDNVINIDN